MNNENAIELARNLTAQYGLPLEGELRRDEAGSSIILRPGDTESGESFEMKVTPGWRSIECEFLPGTFSRDLITVMGEADREQKSIFQTLVRSAMDEGGRVNLIINRKNYSPDDASEWPENWRNLSITLRSPVIESEKDLMVAEETPELIMKWGGIFLSMLIALLPVEEKIDEYEHEIMELRSEGAARRREVTIYERSRINRAACIALQGIRCKVCDIEFAEKYGPIGDGFIHVHHLHPISQIEEGYIPDPGRDLIPLCPNCHAMIHRSDPPFQPEELRSFLKVHEQN